MNNKYLQLLNDIYLNALFSVVCLIFLGYIDWLTGYELSFQFFYFFPLTIFSYNVKYNKFVLFIFVLLTTATWFTADFALGHRYSSNFIHFWNTFSRFIVFISFSIFFNYIIKSRNRINLLNKELTKKDYLVSESIKYAKTIQDSIVPSFTNFTSYFPSSFIISKPKDILSGDFFWYHKKDSELIMALIDCTGHGVPASLLSIIGNILLEQIVIEKGITQPSEILDHLNGDLLHILSSGKEIIDDGMDVSVIKLNLDSNELTISQTSKNIILIKSDGSLIAFKTHGKTIGGRSLFVFDSKYSSETVLIEKGTSIYFYSDGYIDQFGSNNNMKFGYPNFCELVKKAKHLSMDSQSELFSETIENWRGSQKQIDDITVVGIQI